MDAEGVERGLEQTLNKASPVWLCVSDTVTPHKDYMSVWTVSENTETYKHDAKLLSSHLNVSQIYILRILIDVATACSSVQVLES